MKNLGVILNRNLSLEEQIRSAVKKVFFIFATLEKFANITYNEENCKVLENSLVVSHLDCCNSLYNGFRIFYCFDCKLLFA